MCNEWKNSISNYRTSMCSDVHDTIRGPKRTLSAYKAA